MGQQSNSKALKIGVGFDLNEIKKYYSYVQILNIENPLYPNYIDKDNTDDIKKILSFSKEKHIVVDGPYIDINPGTNVNRIKEVVFDVIKRAIIFAKDINAEEIIFLSTYIPQIKVDFYDKGWLQESTNFWNIICEEYPNIRISICNTFETNPDILLNLVQEVNCNNFGLAFDLGHALAYSEITLDEWYSKIKDYTETIYLHSNFKDGDLHLDLDQGLLMNDKGFLEICNDIKSKNLILKQFDKSNLQKNIMLIENM